MPNLTTTYVCFSVVDCFIFRVFFMPLTTQSYCVPCVLQFLKIFVFDGFSKKKLRWFFFRDQVHWLL
jgi:hypothetical protein